MNVNRFFDQRVSAGKPVVLVTVFDTAGSTYSKAGGHMLIDEDGNFCGMLSGGCLEGDLVERARQVIDSGAAQVVTYDLGADDDLWGLGVGCDGTMRMLLQSLTPANGYQPYTAMAEVLNGGSPAVLAIVIDSESGTVAPGASVLMRGSETLGFGLSDEMAATIAATPSLEESAWSRSVQFADGVCQVLYTRLTRMPGLLLLGAGLDSEPVVRIAAELGWRCTVVDHRPAYLESRAYPGQSRTVCCPVAEMHANVDFSDYDMALVMSHHLDSDRRYLAQLANTDIGYVGLLGPAGRRDRLLDELGDAAGELQGRLHGPAGIVLGGRGAGPIALEIVAEMQRYLAGSL